MSNSNQVKKYQFFLRVFWAIVAFTPFSVQGKESIQPFREIGASLGMRGQNFGSVSEGVSIFDANGDGLLDIYLCHDGRPIFKVTAENGTFQPDHAPALPNTLFLNQGNDEQGNPTLVPIQELSKNQHFVKEELLIENKYKPRSQITEDEFGVGRIARMSVAADFNGDGRVDLYVLNAHHGLGLQLPELGISVYPVDENLGRIDQSTPREPILFSTPPFINTDLTDGLKTKVQFGEKEEWEGSNRLFLNRGDQDKDGLPEWEDVTDLAGVGGKWDSAGATVADVDRDGDLDLYVANFLDDDFVGFGTKRFAGNRNQLYLNQIVETGQLTFKEVALDWSVAGLHREENLPNGSYFREVKKVVPISKQIVSGRIVGEEADHSWSAHLMDWNDDGYPDLIVANDVGGNRLRVYQNQKGKRFKRLTQFDENQWEGCWMGVNSGDLDGDGHPEILVTNCGSQPLSIRNTALLVETGQEVGAMARSQINYVQHQSTLHNALFTCKDKQGLQDVTLETTVHFSKLLPPDMTNINNVMSRYREFFKKMKFESSLTGLEFSWGPIFMDVENDGDLDLYLAGSLGRGNDGFFGDWAGSPGRLLINESSPGNWIFSEKTVEYRLLDIEHMEYDHQPPRRKAPGTNWLKRDYIYINDTDAYSEMGVKASQQSATHDLIRMHEAGTGMIQGDLNNDGFVDLVVTHASGYSSLSPKATNLKLMVKGQPRALPGTDKLRKPPTNYEPGNTFVYINGGSSSKNGANWVKIRLIDLKSKNRYAVGAKVVINQKQTHWITVGGTAFGTYSGELLVGLGSEKLETLNVRWPSGDLNYQTVSLEKPVSGEVICLERTQGIIPCSSVEQLTFISK